MNSDCCWFWFDLVQNPREFKASWFLRCWSYNTAHNGNIFLLSGYWTRYTQIPQYYRKKLRNNLYNPVAIGFSLPSYNFPPLFMPRQCLPSGSIPYHYRLIITFSLDQIDRESLRPKGGAGSSCIVLLFYLSRDFTCCMEGAISGTMIKGWKEAQLCANSFFSSLFLMTHF